MAIDFAGNAISQSVQLQINVGHQRELVNVLKQFLNGMSYHNDRPKLHGTNTELEEAMHAEMKVRDFRSLQLKRTLKLAANLIELAYHKHTFAEKLNIALYNWYSIYIDDMASKDPAPFLVFEERFLRRLPQLDPVLDAYSSVLLTMFDIFDTPIANSILSATFEFINTTCLEPEIEALTLVRSGTRFPWFFRSRTGVAVSFALMIFPKSSPLKFATCFQALADMDFWISATNDLLSFHKEELAGETANYISNRAYIEEKTRAQVVSNIKDELLEACRNIYMALESSRSTNALEGWRVFESGYIQWHLEQDRYKLKDLGL